MDQVQSGRDGTLCTGGEYPVLSRTECSIGGGCVSTQMATCPALSFYTIGADHSYSCQCVSSALTEEALAGRDLSTTVRLPVVSAPWLTSPVTDAWDDCSSVNGVDVPLGLSHNRVNLVTASQAKRIIKQL